MHVHLSSLHACMRKEDGEKKSLTDNEQGAGKYQSVDKDEISNGILAIP